MSNQADEPVRHVLLLSGGKDSTALALYMRDKHPEVDYEYVFCDTHKELPEIYEYLARIEAYLGKPITRLSSGYGERGFDHFLKLYGGYLPSPKMRWCTRLLKIEPFEKHVGGDRTVLYVGIRADERRSGYISTKENITPIFPFKEDGITKPDVLRILQESGVGLPKYYEWRSRSGCYFCFFQQRAEWVRLKERHPDLFELSKAYEKEEQGYTWVQGEGLSALEQPDRVDEILRREKERKERLAKRRRPASLAETFGFAKPSEPDEDGCLICQL
jgi:3'-phosphoadenosine 5'-phosphosulfate sulfotransferase (PAPS reductase)/FAD synthetase